MGKQIMTREEKSAYARGYNAGANGRWPAHYPPIPPESVIADLMSALQKLRDGIDGALAKFDEDDELNVKISPLIEAADDAMCGVTEWLKRKAGVA